MIIVARVTLALMSTLAWSPAFADDYRAEARAFVARVDNPGSDGKSLGLTGTYFFGDVGTDDVPLGEAAYLGRESLISLQGHRSGIDGEYQDLWRLNSEIYIPTALPLFLAMGITRYETIEYVVQPFDVIEGHDTAWDAAIGITPFDGLRVATRFHEGIDYHPNVDIRYVGKLPNNHWFGVSTSLVDTDGGGLHWGISADYFPDPTLKLGASFEQGYDTLWLIAEKFFTPRASLMVAYANGDLPDAWRIEGAFRF